MKHEHVKKLTPRAAAALAAVHGIELGKDFHALSRDATQKVLDAADAVNYQAPKDASGSRGRYFYEYLNRLVKDEKSAPKEGRQDKVKRVVAILSKNYEGMTDKRSSLVDLLADSLHFAMMHGIDFDACISSAKSHVEAEQGGEG